ncbi:glycosyltransferase [Chitinophaga silvatica]|uniref:Glycosyltransferase n=1 Tax=Chitinophaga silvatica TaxID=2282649 RepID=A0A3E1YCF9_9BACT|nr:glycosyltransferase [Chitinophaga silvatica]RFS23948.1 glycosyltransferase [Chitinophaga silvatica]
MSLKLSIAVTSFNYRDFLEECLSSILSQEINVEYEIVVGDDCSNDSTADYLRQLAQQFPNVKPIIRSQNIGALANAIDVIMNCQGEYIAFIDGDDHMLPYKLQKQVNYLDSHPDCAFVVHDLRVFDSETKKTLYYMKNPNPHQELFDIQDLVLKGTFFGHCSKMFRKTSIPAEGFDPTTKNVGDYSFHIANAKFGKIGYINEVLGQYRKHSQGVSLQNSTNKDKILNAMNDQLKAIKHAEGHVHEAFIHKGKSRIFINTAILFMEIGDFSAAKKLLNQSNHETNRTYFNIQHRILSLSPNKVTYSAMRRVKRVAKKLIKMLTNTNS